MLLQLPTNITAWICHTIVTSTLIKAVGVGSVSWTTTAASVAATRWVLKDGLGALGRLFIGGRFGSLFDDDPKQWRLYADFIGSAGSVFELATPLYPAYLLPLASFGNLAKAVARGLKDPSFRVIQNHFATSGNLGEVAAKEEVWEVAAQLIGLLTGILILATPELTSSYPVLVTTWLSIRLLHLWLRYQSLLVLRFPKINLKRARLLAQAHVSGCAVPGYAECNKQENILVHPRFLKPRVFFGVSFNEILGSVNSTDEAKALIKLYHNEQYILAACPSKQKKELQVFISFKVGASSLSVLRSVWQTYWLHEHWVASEVVHDQLLISYFELEQRFGNFVEQLEASGWDLKKHMTLRVPAEVRLDFPSSRNSS